MPGGADAVAAALVDIESLSHEGVGVGHIAGKVVFVQGALPGESVEVEWRRRGKRFDEGRVRRVVTPAPERREPPCPHFQRCGGCVLQHMEDEAQLASKAEAARKTLQHVGGVQPESWVSPMAGPCFGYRRRARLGVRQITKLGDKGRVVIGFRERSRAFVADLDECRVLDPRLSLLIAPLREVIHSLSCADRIPQVELSAGEQQVVAVLRHLVPLGAQDLDRLRVFSEAHGVSVWTEPNRPETAALLAPVGAPLPEYRYEPGGATAGLRFQFAPTDFVQVNATINGRVISRALEWLQVQPHDVVLDLFCGLGNFTLPLAQRARQVIGLEADAALVTRARQNADINQLINCTFEHSDLYEEHVKLPVPEASAIKVLMDPPRTGALGAIKALQGVRVERLLYVSCNPATLARDAQHLVQQQGYRFVSAGVMDMFPQTAHVEVMALFVPGARP